MVAVYAVFEGNKILRMSRDRKELEEYIKSFPWSEQKKLSLKVRYTRGAREWEQGFWMDLNNEGLSE